LWEIFSTATALLHEAAGFTLWVFDASTPPNEIIGSDFDQSRSCHRRRVRRGVHAPEAMESRQRARAGGTLNTTALVRELYLKLSSSANSTFHRPAQFFDYAAQAMRHILVDRARE
jgi:hypothetical protein